MKTRFARAAALIALPLALVSAVACGSGDGIYTDKVDEDGKIVQKAQITESKMVMEGDIFNFADGARSVVIPAAKAGTPHDLPCILFRDRDGGGQSSVAYGGASCDWDKAWGNRPAAQQPATAPVPMPKGP